MFKAFLLLCPIIQSILDPSACAVRQSKETFDSIEVCETTRQGLHEKQLESSQAVLDSRFNDIVRVLVATKCGKKDREIYVENFFARLEGDTEVQKDILVYQGQES